MEEILKKVRELLFASKKSIRLISLKKLSNETGFDVASFRRYIVDGNWVEGVIYHKPTKSTASGDGSRCTVFVDWYAYDLWASGNSIEQIQKELKKMA